MELQSELTKLRLCRLRHLADELLEEGRRAEMEEEEEKEDDDSIRLGFASHNQVFYSTYEPAVSSLSFRESVGRQILDRVLCWFQVFFLRSDLDSGEVS